MIGVILAAGEGRRLKGIVPAGMKPLLVVNGQPLIVRLARQLLGVCSSIIVVASPRNIEPIVDVMDGIDADYIIQPRATGPGDALRRAAKWIGGSMIAVMGDNILSDGTIASVAEQARSGVVVCTNIGVIPEEQLHRFTRVWHDAADPKGSLCTEEGPNVRMHSSYVWLGPLLLPGVETSDVLEAHAAEHAGVEFKIGPWIPEIARAANVPGTMFPVDAQDIGTPEALL